MTDALKSLVECGTKLWVDSIDPELVQSSFRSGATGATSNPIIVADLLKSGRFDDEIRQLAERGLDDDALAWEMTDRLVTRAEEVFRPVFERTAGNDGYVSFELDPLLEDLESAPSHEKRVASYIELAKKWSQSHPNRLIKVPATPAGLEALEEMVAAGVNVNVTLIFSERQYRSAVEACWRGAQKLASTEKFKSVFSIFVSRLDVYTEKTYPQLSSASQGQVGILNAKRLWNLNRSFWEQKRLPLEQEIIFASTGTKKPTDSPDKYVGEFAGSDIQTNPPATNAAVAKLAKSYSARIAELPASEIQSEIDEVVDFAQLEADLMAEGLMKFAEPQKALLALMTKLR